ncbi:hypothetical protein DFH06DRAFT_1166375 [Mycena polygramma]|nr:hypothetical protein DFH06DRAFT_1166375 [Mycena polygramma]
MRARARTWGSARRGRGRTGRDGRDMDEEDNEPQHSPTFDLPPSSPFEFPPPPPFFAYREQQHQSHSPTFEFPAPSSPFFNEPLAPPFSPSSYTTRHRQPSPTHDHPPPSSPFDFDFAHVPPSSFSSSPYATQHPPPPPSPFASPERSPFASPYVSQQQAYAHPPPSPYAPSLSASPVPSSAIASSSAGGPSSGGTNAGSLMLPPLTHMYKRSLSAPCTARVALPGSQSQSPEMAPMGSVQEQEQPCSQEQEQQQGPQEQYGHAQQGQQQQQVQTVQRQTRYAHTHLRRDTISLPVAPSQSGAGARFGGAVSGGSPIGGGYQHLAPRRERGAYTYPPPYAHEPLPSVPAFSSPIPEAPFSSSTFPDQQADADDDVGLGPGPTPSYGGVSQAGNWWEQARGGGGGGQDEPQAHDEADGGWADGGVARFSEYAPAPPSPEPSIMSPYTAHVKAPPSLSTDTTDSSTTPARDPYAQPLPISPVSDDSGGGDNNARFHFPVQPAISSFSTLSGWAGDFSASPPTSAGAAQGAGTFSFVQAQGHFQAQASGSGSGSLVVNAVQNAVESGSGRRGASPPRTSGWYQPPGWENSIQGHSQPVAAGMAMPAGAGDAWGGESYAPTPLKAPWASASAQQGWPAPRGDVEMYDAGQGWGAQR